MSAFVPPGTFTQCVTLQIVIPGEDSFPNAPSSGTPLKGTGIGIQVQAVNNPSVEPLHPITLTVPFNQSAMTFNRRDQLVLARYDDVHNTWIMLPSSVDPIQNSVTAQTDHLSLYQIMVALPVADLSGVRTYPNPFRPSLGHSGIHFANLPTDATIEIYTLTGEKVQSLSATPQGRRSGITV